MRFAPVRTIASLLAGLLSAAVCPGAGPGVSQIEKYFRATECVATAAQPTVEQLSAAREEGFRTIINLREPSEHDAEAEDAAVERLGLRYVAIPVRTADPKSEQVDAFLKVTEDASIYPVLIHCGSGNRVGAFWMIRRVLVDGWTAEDAEREARQIGMKSPNLKEFALEYIRGRSATR